MLLPGACLLHVLQWPTPHEVTLQQLGLTLGILPCHPRGLALPTVALPSVAAPGGTQAQPLWPSRGPVAPTTNTNTTE